MIDKFQKYVNLAQLIYLVLTIFITTISAIFNNRILILLSYKFSEYKKIFIVIALIFLIINFYFIIKFVLLKQIKIFIYSILLFISTLALLVIIVFNLFGELVSLKIYGFYDISNGKIAKSFYGEKMAESIKIEMESLYKRKIFSKKVFIEKTNKTQLSDLNIAVLENLNRDAIEKILSKDDKSLFAIIGFIEGGSLKEVIFTLNQDKIGGDKYDSERDKKLINNILNKVISSNISEDKKISFVSNIIFLLLNSSFISVAYDQLGEDETDFYVSTILKNLNNVKNEYPLIKNEINFLSADILAVKNNFYLKNKQYNKLAFNILEVIKLSKYYPYLSKEEFYKSYIQNYFSNCEKSLQRLENNPEENILLYPMNFYDELGFVFENMPYNNILKILDKYYKELIKLYGNEPILFLYWGDYLKIHHDLLLLPKGKSKLIDEIEEKYKTAARYVSLRNDDLLTTIVNIKLSYIYLIRAMKTKDAEAFKNYTKKIAQHLRVSSSASELLLKSNSIESLEKIKKLNVLFERILEKAKQRLVKDKYREH